METISLIIVGVLVLLAIARIVLAKLGSDFRSSIDSWTTYFRGPGVLQLVFLIIGGIGAGASAYYAPFMRNLSVVGQMKEYHIDPTKPTLYQENIQNYSYLTIFARATEPNDASARLTVFRNGMGKDGDISRLEDVKYSTWSRLDLPNNYSNMGLIVEPPAGAGAVSATKVDVLVYLNLK